MRRREPGGDEGAFGGLRGERRRVPGEAGVQRVGSQDERFLQIRPCNMPGGDAVLTQQDLAHQSAGAPVELRILGSVLQRGPTFRLRETPGRDRRTDSG